ncbi:MAG: Antigen 332, putative [uncultured Sulfurovum sp.]|uniref:Antigen 332, putative n=1 Tax=uncultured Sulfurovum sp. TaxID=269237 RepID=A0A6S6TTH3_9BACT|nr:MAG: Antigen 332, putative [uncultured Sulfurovum sp.]
MYYGYNDDRELILADEAFIELLGFHSFKELSTSNIMDNLKFENKQIVIKQDYQTIHSDFSHHEIYCINEECYLVELQNIQIEKTPAFSTTAKHLNTNYQAIYLDVEKISEEIGLSVNDYKLYLDSFIDQSIIDEKRLLEGNDKVVKNLSNLALTLKIPHINILLLKIQKLSHRERMPLIDQYYTKLALLTLEKPEDYQEDEVDNIFEEDKSSQEDKEEVLNARFSDLLKNVDEKEKLTDTFEAPVIPESPDLVPNHEAIEEQISSNSKVKQISLENVEELPISYNPQTAADELNLPVVLIEEFVDDFIEQARQDKDHLLTSYYQQDLDNIHELGHKLKGAASNLRINELSDILEEIQFCADYSQLEGLFIKYWGHFLSLENYMKQLKRV